MSFHPRMAYDATFHKSARLLEDEGPPFAYSAENRARFDDYIAAYDEVLTETSTDWAPSTTWAFVTM